MTFGTFWDFEFGWKFSLKWKKDHLSCYPILLINIQITAVFVKGGRDHEKLVFFVTKRIIFHISVWKCQITKHVFLYCAEKRFICFTGGHLCRFMQIIVQNLSIINNRSAQQGILSRYVSKQATPVDTPVKQLQNTSSTLTNFNNKNILHFTSNCVC